MKKKAPIENPIDKDKVTDRPGTLQYAHHVGSAVIKPIDKGRTKGLALDAMYHQTNQQIDQIREQVELLMEQAKRIHDRVEVSEKIYQASIGFKPIIGQTYYLYEKKDGTFVVSMVSEREWGKNPPYAFISTIKLLPDHTWDVQNPSL